MNNSMKTARDLLAAYDQSLEQQIVGQGSNLACRDEDLWKQVEELLRDGTAQERHCLGLDPLRVMEESLMEAAAAAAAPNGGRRVKARVGLVGLAKAFEVLEQAALNLYIGPWREEYKIVKMYSGTFTHYIKPVLSMPQIEVLFGLLGYQSSMSRQEQFCLQLSRISPTSPDDLLRLSCAFFLARWECCLLLTALGTHAGEGAWELSVVRERQMGHSVQVALENTKKTLKVNHPVMEPFEGEVDVDLYTDEQVNGREVVVKDDESPHSLSWVPQNKTHGNGVTSLYSSSTSLPTREHVCISTLNCQLTNVSPVESDRSCSANKRPGRSTCEESTFDKADFHSQPRSLQLEAIEVCKKETEANSICSCLKSPHVYIKHCVECKSLHNISCAWLKDCTIEGHTVLSPGSTTEGMNESGALSPESESLRVSHMSPSQTLTGSSASVSAVALCDGPKSIIALPITYHDCCNLAQLDPQVLCVICGVFHSHSCIKTDYCHTHHRLKKLGVCVCGKQCTRTPLVLCRYCGNEYCNDCWYRSPVECKCGQTFDQSSSV